jgi:signal transduction histidine kinase
VAATADDTSIASPGLSVEVLVAGVAFSVGAGVTGLSALSSQDPPSTLLLLGWPVLAVVGGVLLDQHPGASLARTLTALSLAPVFVLTWAVIRVQGVESADLAASAAELAAFLACSVAIAIPWSFRAPTSLPAGRGLVAVAGSGALLVLGAQAWDWGAWTRVAGWAMAVLGTVGTWSLIADRARDLDRTARRRLGWLLAVLSTEGVVVSVAWTLLPGRSGYYATCGALMIGAITIANLWLDDDFRPLDEHLLDLGLLLGIVVVSAITAALVRLGSELADRPSPGTTMVFTALLTAAMAAPAALWVRRSTLARRYGSGLIPPEDVAAITADLHAQTEPRDLLDKAARMVAAASGSTGARIVLGDDDPSAPEHWAVHPLEVGGDRVGSLLIESPHPEGPEARQQQVVAQLLPTVALVARAVGLAVEAEHARRDVARERDAERKRVMGDLHDGLGPVLAGMSMRVQAALRTAISGEYAELLTSLAEELATSRTDLRRIVAGITPSTLDDGDLGTALTLLVDSFRSATDTPRVDLSVELGCDVAPAIKVAVYRSVAEGITNGLRHAQARTIEVGVRATDGRVVVEVADDGVGGPVVPGVGLSSLARRAESLGGRMTVCAGRPGTTLRLDLPALEAST